MRYWVRFPTLCHAFFLFRVSWYQCIPSTYQVHTMFVSAHASSTYQVHTKYIPSEVFQFKVQTSMYSVVTRAVSLHTMLSYSTALNRALHGTYHLVLQPVKIQHMNSKLESVRKRLHLPSLCLFLCKLHPVSNLCVPLNRDRLYKVVCTVKCQFKAVM